MTLNEMLQTLAQRTPAWLPGDKGLLCLASLRLQMNVNGLPFPTRLGRAERKALLDYMNSRADLLGDYSLQCDLDDNRPEVVDFLAERWLADPEALGNGDARLLLREDESRGLLIGAEDHLRFHALGNLDALEEALADFRAGQQELARNPGLALDPDGRLITSSPFLCGNGLRLALVLHLPALSWWGGLEARLDPLFVRGFCYRTWQDGFGDFVLLENLSGQKGSAEEILQQARNILTELEQGEEEARQELLNHRQLDLQDRIHRARALCAGSRLMGYAELVEHLSMLRLGRQLGLDLPGPVSPLLLELAPGHLGLPSGDSRESRRLARLRADRLRELLAQESRVPA